MAIPVNVREETWAKLIYSLAVEKTLQLTIQENWRLREFCKTIKQIGNLRTAK
jgi:hypothetical protein